MNEQNHYITVREILETMEESFGLSDWETVKKELETMQSPINFTGKTALTLSKDHFGRISLLRFFNEMEYAGEWLTVDERGFTTINNLKRSLVLAKTSQEALQGLPNDSKSYHETMTMLEDNLLKASALMLSIELDFRNIHHNFKKGSE